MARKDEIEHYTTIDAFFKDASKYRKNLVKNKLRGMPKERFDYWIHFLRLRHFNGGSYGFTFSKELMEKLWEHYNP